MEALTAEEMLATLDDAWPSWQFWTVRTWDGHAHGTVWCARRHDDHRVVLSATAAARLAGGVAGHSLAGRGGGEETADIGAMRAATPPRVPPTAAALAVWAVPDGRR